MKQDKLFDRGLPSSLEAERMTLGGLLVQPERLALVQGIISAEDFSLEAHKTIYAAIERISQEMPVDKVTVTQELMAMGKLAAVGGMTYVSSLDEGMPQALNIEAYAAIVKEKALLRQIIHTGQSLIDRACVGSEKSAEIAADAKERMGKIETGANPGIPETVGAIVEELGADAILKPHLRSRTGISTIMLPSLANFMPTLEPGHFTVIAAPPGGGKTTLAMQLALDAAMRGRYVVVFSYEMSNAELVRRLVCLKAGLNSQHIQRGKLSAAEMGEANYQLGEISGLPIRIDESKARTPAKIRAALHKIRNTQPVDMVLIDFLQLMVPGKPITGTEAIDFIAYELKYIAQEMETSVVAASQFSNEGLDRIKEGNVSMRYARGSGSIYQAMDNGIIVHPAKANPGEIPDDRRIPIKLKIDKSRHGPTGEVDVLWDMPRYRFYELERYEEKQERLGA